MKLRHIFIFLWGFLPALACHAAKENPDTISVRRAFLEMPTGMIELLSEDTRFEMMVYYENGIDFKSLNNLRGESHIVTYTDDYLKVGLTDASTLQMKVLTLKNGNQILMTIHTIGDDNDAAESEIRFFDTAFNELPRVKYFPNPKLADYFDIKKGYKTNMKEIEGILPFYSYRFEANADNCNVTGKLSTADIMTIEDRKIVEMFLKPQVTYVWNGKDFRVVKSLSR